MAAYSGTRQLDTLTHGHAGSLGRAGGTRTSCDLLAPLDSLGDRPFTNQLEVVVDVDEVDLDDVKSLVADAPHAPHALECTLDRACALPTSLPARPAARALSPATEGQQTTRCHKREMEDHRDYVKHTYLEAPHAELARPADEVCLKGGPLRAQALVVVGNSPT